MSAENRSLLLLAAFARALSHKIRTPLSVISNELSIVGASGGEGATAASNRVLEIAAILKESCPPDPSTLRFESIDLVSAATALGVISAENVPEVRTDKAAFEFLCSLLARILDRHTAGVSPVSVGVFEDRVEIQLQRPWIGKVPASQVASDSITEFLTVKLGLEALEAPLIDGMVDALGIKIHAALHDALVLRMEIPRA